MGKVAKNLKALMDGVEGMNPTKLSKETGVNQSTIWKILKGRIADPGSEVIAPLATRFRVSIAQLRGEAPIGAGVAEQAPTYGAVVTLRVYGAEASAGAGRLPNEHDTVVGSMQVSQEWLRRNVPGITSPKNLAVITALGGSMEPTFKDGDILLVDRGVDEVKVDTIYVLTRSDASKSGELFVKRLQRKLNGDLLIKSDNPLFEDELLPVKNLPEIRVLGRVVYIWNGKKS